MVLGKLTVPGRSTIWITEGVVWTFLLSSILRGWSGGAKVLGKLSVPRRPTSLDYSRARAYCACSRCGWGFVLDIFSLIYLFSFLSPSLFFLPLFGRRPDID